MSLFNINLNDVNVSVLKVRAIMAKGTLTSHPSGANIYRHASHGTVVTTGAGTIKVLQFHPLLN